MKHQARTTIIELHHEKTCFLYMHKKRRRAAALFYAADRCLCFCYIYSTIPLLPKSENFKPVAIFCGCTAWFVLDLVRNPEDRFSCDMAQLQYNTNMLVMYR